MDKLYTFVADHNRAAFRNAMEGSGQNCNLFHVFRSCRLCHEVVHLPSAVIPTLIIRMPGILFESAVIKPYSEPRSGRIIFGPLFVHAAKRGIPSKK